MTTRAPATQGQISRAIRALQKAGLRVKGVAPDGTVLVDSGDEDAIFPPPDASDDAKYSDDDSSEA